MNISCIVTHPGGAHKDDLLACSLMIAKHGVTVFRREPTPEDLADPRVCVIDVGGEHAPERMNFDHHQFPADHPPTCALSLVLQHLNLYEDARAFCDWLEPAEWFDTRGPNVTAKWLGVSRDVLMKLNSPIDVTLLRRFAATNKLEPGDPIWQMMCFVGEDLVYYLRNLRERLNYLKEHAEFLQVEDMEVVFLPRNEEMPSEAAQGMGRFIAEAGKEEAVGAMIYPDRRGKGYAISRYNDDPRLDFSGLADGYEDVHFAHARGFVAKTSATELDRLKELLLASYTPLSSDS